MSLSFINKIRACFGLALLTLLAIAASAYVTARQFLELTRQTTQSSEGLAAMAAVLSALQDAETGQRGYLLTQSKPYLETYETAMLTLPRRIAALQSWSAARPDLKQNVDRVVMLATRKTAELNRTILLNDQQSPAAALALVRTDEGKQVMDDIRVATSQIDTEERDALAQLLRRSQATGRQSLYTTLLGSIMAAALLACSLIVMSRDVTSRHRSGAIALAQSTEQLVANENLLQENAARKLAQDAHQRAEETVRGLNVGLEEGLLRRTAQLEAANKELEAFSYSVSHDLRSPLRAINGFSQALREEAEGTLNESAQDCLDRIIAATHRMSQLIDDLLNLARVSRSQLLRERVDLTGVVQSVVEGLREQDPQRPVDIIVAPNVVADGDPKLLRVVLENLLGNAWKFTGKRPLARIEFGSSAEQGSENFFVRDNGAGFDPAYCDKLFGVFQRLHSSDDFPGTGIGLATVQRIVHRHGGRVWASGAQEQGATFYFSL